MGRVLSSADIRSFAQIVSTPAIERPDDVGYTFLYDADKNGQDPSLTYFQLARRAKAIAATIRNKGYAGQRAMLLYPPGLGFVTAIYGCLCGEVVAVPAYPPRISTSDNARQETGPVQRLKAILGDAKPAVALTLAELLSTVQQALAGTGIECIATDLIPDEAADDWTDPQTSHDTLAVLQYTSGSTATPKGVMLTHGNLLSNCLAISKTFQTSAATRIVLWLPPYHDMGLVGAILMPMVRTSPIWLMAPAAFIQKPVRWLSAISKYRASITGSPNFGYDLCTRAISEADRATLDLSCLEIAFSGAEPIDPTTLEKFAAMYTPAGLQKDVFLPCYGLAEATLMVSARSPRQPVASHEVPASAEAPGSDEVVSCGPAADAVKVSIVNPSTKQPCATGDLGEIWVQSPGVAAGYWQNTEATREIFQATTADGAGPFLRTGDLGFLSDTGLCIAGRLKDLIIVRGVKHFPQDIERSIQNSCPSLRAGAGAAFTVPDETGQERLVIVQEVERASRNDDPAPMLASIRESLSTGHGLDALAIVLIRPGQFPKTTSGKVQRRACRDRYLKNEFETIAESKATAPKPVPAVVACKMASMSSDSLEAWLCERLAASVGVDVSEIDPAEPFARYGLDSIKGVALAGEIAAYVGHDVPAMALWDYPSIVQLAAYIAESNSQSKAA